MTKIGTTKYERSDGTTVEVDLYAAGTFPEEPVRLALSDGRIGVPFLTSPSQADTPIRVAASDGSVYGVARTGGIVDDWERGTFDPYTQFTSSSFSNLDINSQAAFAGDYGVDSTGDYQGVFGSLPGDGLPHYPARGDTFDAWVKFEEFLDDHNREIRLKWDMDPADGYNNENGYHVHVEDTFAELQMWVDGNKDDLLELNAFDGTDMAWYRVIVDYQDPTITVTIEDESGTQVDTGSVDDTTHDYGGGGVAYFFRDEARGFVDEWKLVL